jgi:Flp pilus assembly protein TadG
MTRKGDDRGSVAVETAVVAPILVFLLLLVVFAGRVAQAEGDVRRAASEAARAASLEQFPDAATTEAERVVTANLSASGVVCGALDVDVETDDLVPGGSVAVTVRCTASMEDVTLLGVPGEREFVARSLEVVDRYRGEAAP